MIPSLSGFTIWAVLLMLLLMELVEVWSHCCHCPSTRCNIPQWPCCDKNSKWYHSFFG
ncbi:uncharacterized protein LOC121530266 [Drosophila eugracilis]|uniref:uncharacterized protein LOC121530266 n=1 Tax=Drosophila eugracilis TaxID=29029 RepID=UPI001BDAB207|nr:uncharacterized protein LOC121530266 [Drosophila eugracilis]